MKKNEYFSEEHKQLMIEKAELLKALSHPARLCILEQLIYIEEKNVSDLQLCMDISQSSLSQHLAKLRDLNIVSTRKEGNQVFYSCVREDIRRFITELFRKEIK